MKGYRVLVCSAGTSPALGIVKCYRWLMGGINHIVTTDLKPDVGGSIYSAASAAFEAVTGVRTVASQHAAEVVELTDDINAERKAKRQLQGELGDVTDDLATQRTVNRQLRGDVTDLSDDLLSARRQLDDDALELVNFRGRRVAVSEAVSETADMISDRARKSASREVGSMAGEALPWVGTAVIVGVTTLELRDLCQTITDMNELKRAFDPTLVPDENQRTVCSMEVPSRQELWEATTSSPQRAWEQASAVMPTMDDIRSIDLSDIDWTAYQTSVGQGFSSASNAMGRAVDSSVQKAGSFWEWLTEEGAPNTEISDE